MAVRNIFERLKFWKRSLGHNDPVLHQAMSNPEFILAKRLKRYEKFVTCIQSIVMWDNPVMSVACVLAINLFFWIFLWLECKCYGIIATVLLAVSVHDAWTGHIWPEISVAGPQPPPDTPPHPSVVAVSKLVSDCCSSVRQQLARMRTLRAQQPGAFCCSCSLVCSCLLLIGRSVSGLLLVYTLLMALLLVPGLYRHCVPPEFKRAITQHVVCVQQAFAKYSSGDTSDDEYMPVTTSEDMALLTKASDFHHDTYDSLTNPETSSEVLSGPLMPSHEEDSIGTLSDLEPGAPFEKDDSDSDQGDHQIEFQSGHFNGDSSSDDSDVFSRDLVFSEDRDERDSATLSSFITQTVASNLMGSVGLLASVMRPRQTTDTSSRQRRSSDSDADDFEIISREEVNSQES